MTKEELLEDVISEELADMFHRNDMGAFAKRIVELGETYTGETISEVLKSTKQKFVRKHLRVD